MRANGNSPDSAARWRRALRNVLLVAAGALVAVSWLLTLPGAGLTLGHDLILYQNHLRDMLSGAPMYPARELAGPFTIADGDILYPPFAILAFMPTLILPLPLWWLIPAAITAWAFRDIRLKPWAIVALLLCLANPLTPELVWVGNPDIWLVAALAAAVRWNGLWAAFVFFKPSVFEFSLVGIRSRWWWVVAAGFATASLVMLPATIDWIHVLLNSRGAAMRSGFGYSLLDMPLLAMPLIAWYGRSRGPGQPATQGAGTEARPD